MRCKGKQIYLMFRNILNVALVLDSFHTSIISTVEPLMGPGRGRNAKK